MLSQISQMSRRPLSPTPPAHDARGDRGHMVTAARSFTEHAHFTGLGIDPRLSRRHANIRPIFDYDQRRQRINCIATAGVWDGDDRRAAVAKLPRLDGGRFWRTGSAQSFRDARSTSSPQGLHSYQPPGDGTSRAHARTNENASRSRSMKTLVPIDVLDFDDALWVTSDRFDRMDAVRAIANEPALYRSLHVSFSVRLPSTLNSQRAAPRRDPSLDPLTAASFTDDKPRNFDIICRVKTPIHAVPDLVNKFIFSWPALALN
jgi:hypothetical protein